MVDFAKARPSDRGWWRWLYAQLDRLESRNLLALYRLQHAQNMAAVGVADAKGVEHHWGRGNDITVNTFRALFPWLVGADDKADFAGAVDQLRDLWVGAWGDPDDPETQRKIDATAAAMGV